MTENNSSSERLVTTEKLIAYIDILAGKKLIETDTMDTNLNKIKQIYKFAQNYIKTINVGSPSFVDFKIFSDNILLTLTPQIDNSPYMNMSINNFFGLLAFIQMKALEEDILLRGGLTVGSICVNEVFAWGKGLLRAINLEEKFALYPRIIVDSPAKNIIDKILLVDSTRQFKMLVDLDGWLFVDYLRIYGNSEIYLNAIYRHLSYLDTEINKEYRNTSVIEKLNWQRNYCNCFLNSIQQPMQIGGLNAQ